MSRKWATARPKGRWKSERCVPLTYAKRTYPFWVAVALLLVLSAYYGEPAPEPVRMEAPAAFVAPEPEPEPEPEPHPDAQVLAEVIWAEARGETYEGKVAVGAVVVNRIQRPTFPEDIHSVVHSGGQFASRGGARPTEECVRAAEEALAGQDPTGGAVYFYNPVTATDPWIRTRPVLAQIGNHIFAGEGTDD